jgi:hypothetical protein
MAAPQYDSDIGATETAYQCLPESITGARARYWRLYQRGTSFFTVDYDLKVDVFSPILMSQIPIKHSGEVTIRAC